MFDLDAKLEHIQDYEYKGHEVVIILASDGYICDIRADNYDGDMIAGYRGLETKTEAVKTANDYIDNLGA